MKISKANVIGVDKYENNGITIVEFLLEVASWKTDKPYEYVTIAYFGPQAEMMYLEVINDLRNCDMLVTQVDGKWVPVKIDNETGDPYLLMH